MISTGLLERRQSERRPLIDLLHPVEATPGREPVLAAASFEAMIPSVSLPTSASSRIADSGSLSRIRLHPPGDRASSCGGNDTDRPQSPEPPTDRAPFRPWSRTLGRTPCRGTVPARRRQSSSCARQREAPARVGPASLAALLSEGGLVVTGLEFLPDVAHDCSTDAPSHTFLPITARFDLCVS